MQKSNLLYLLLITLLFSSCDKWLEGQVVDYDLPEHKPVLTIYCSSETGDDFLELKVGATLPILDERDEPDTIENINVKVFRDNIFLQNINGSPYSKRDTLANWVNPSTGELILVIDTSFTYEQSLDEEISSIEGTNYRLEVSADGYETAYVEAEVPPLPDVSITVNKNVSVNTAQQYANYESVGDAYTITFNDVSEEEQYYLIWAYGRWENYTNNIHLETGNPIISKEEDVFLLSDKQSTIVAPLRLEHLFEEGQERPLSVVFIFHAVSKSYADFYRSMNAYLNANSNPFAEPVALYTNVENGLGMFSMMNKKSFEVIR